MVNAIAPIFTNPDGLFLQTIYHPLRLYAEHAQEIALDPTVICETYTLESDDRDRAQRGHRIADLGPFKLLDVSATRDEAGQTVTLGIVNRHQDQAITTTIGLDGAPIASAAVYEVNGDDPHGLNSFERPDAVVVQERQATPNGTVWS